MINLNFLQLFNQDLLSQGQGQQLTGENSDLAMLADQLGIPVEELQGLSNEELFATLLMHTAKQNPPTNQVVSQVSETADSQSLTQHDKGIQFITNPTTKPLQLPENSDIATTDIDIEQLKPTLEAFMAAMPPQIRQQFAAVLESPQPTETLQKLIEQVKLLVKPEQGKIDLPVTEQAGPIITNNNTQPNNPLHQHAQQPVQVNPSHQFIKTLIENDFNAQGTQQLDSLIKELFPSLNKTVSTNPTTVITASPLINDQAGLILPQQQVPTTYHVTPNAMNSQILSPLTSQNWQDSFSDQIVWLSQQQLKSATIKLNPPELGPLEVSIKLNQDQASVVFNTHHPQVRDAIEHALPRLREMFQESGVNLGDVDVSDQSSSQLTDQQQQAQQLIEQLPQWLDDSVDVEPLQSKTYIVKQGLVDYYA